MTKKPHLVSVNTQPTKEIVVNGLTRDITVDACIFDLIDNSIDAARDAIISSKDAELPDEELPSSYDGYNITITLDGSGITIIDNCGGIPSQAIKDSAFRFGQKSGHTLGIGVFGVGLNRALFKLGTINTVESDNGKDRTLISLNVKEYMDSEDWSIPAQIFPSKNKIGTKITLKRPIEEISKQFSDESWVNELKDKIGRIYCAFINKGLKIKVNKSFVSAINIKLRPNSLFTAKNHTYNTDSGVRIQIMCGQHELHRYAKIDADYDLKANNSLTNQYGWTVFCNERAIIISDTSYKTGWTAGFHTEFYGFVGKIEFVCSDPSKLPWNTTKTDIDTNNPSYISALDVMQKYAKAWRDFSADIKRYKKPETSEPPQPLTGGKPLPPKGKPSTPPASKGGKPTTVKKSHNEFTTVLPSDVDESMCSSDKILSLVHEAKELDLRRHTYSGLALIRMLFDQTLKKYLIEEGKIDDVKLFAANRMKTLPPENEIKKIDPSLENMLLFIEKNVDVFGEYGVHLKPVIKKVQHQLGQLNGVVHNYIQTIQDTKALEIRTELLPLLRMLIEKSKS